MKKERLALVTGAGSGLPRGIALSLARLGYRVAITIRPGGTPADAALAELRRFDKNARAFEIDFALPAELTGFAKAVHDEHGGADVIVHGVGPMLVRRFERCDRADYEAMLETNLGSAVRLCAAFLPYMREQRFGRLVFFGMQGSSVTRPARGLALYAAAKSALVTFARTLALEEASSGISVNVVEAGDIQNKTIARETARGIAARNPTGRTGSWEDVADAVAFLVRDDAEFINGAVLAVNGGHIEAHERT